jgi:hypothetical protein
LDEFQQWNLVIKYRHGKLAIVPDALSRRPDYLNAITLEREAEAFIAYIPAYLTKNALLDDDDLKKKILDDAHKFVMVDGGLFGKILHRKIKDGITAPYVEVEFRGDTMHKLHEQYGHLQYQSLKHLLEPRAWWPTMQRDFQNFTTACPNC